MVDRSVKSDGSVSGDSWSCCPRSCPKPSQGRFVRLTTAEVNCCSYGFGKDRVEKGYTCGSPRIVGCFVKSVPLLPEPPSRRNVFKSADCRRFRRVVNHGELQVVLSSHRGVGFPSGIASAQEYRCLRWHHHYYRHHCRCQSDIPSPSS